LTDGAYVEDVVLVLFGLSHQKCISTFLLLVLIFNNRDTLSLSSTRVILKLITFSEQAEQNFSIVFPITVTQNPLSNYTESLECPEGLIKNEGCFCICIFV
jgi:hypothetical protein